MSTLRLVLGDQLTANISSLDGGDPATDKILMAEVADETTYVPHHKKKIAFILAAMRAHARALREAGWTVRYVTLDDPANTGLIPSEITRAMAECGCDAAIATEPGEWRLRVALSEVPRLEMRPDTRFIVTEVEFASWADGRKQLRMEYFYRDVRRKTGLLMDGATPVGGKWNYDAENRKPAKPDLFMPAPFEAKVDAETEAVLDLVEARFPNHFGRLRPFSYAVTREDAEAAAEHFRKAALPKFGDYQDAMLRGEPFLYHSLLSAYINVGLLDPLELCQRAEAEWRAGHAPLNAVEGFIRQIIGWREYVRGIYFWAGPDYVRSNALETTRPLPDFYWTAETDMACVASVVGQTRDYAYAHHIQRLMVTGTFAMLAGIDPHEVHEWYLAVYIDAFEWVEAPNTLGMSQFADGGLLASKPYAASGAYINRMSDYCQGCSYDVKRRTGEGACPFNSLYWDFLARNERHLGKNPRLAQMYRTWAKFTPDIQNEIRDHAAVLLASLDDGGRI